MGAISTRKAPSRRRRSIPVLLALLGALAVTGTASAVLTPIDGGTLTAGGGAATFTTYNTTDNEGCFGGTAYSPAEEGDYNAQSDAFDGGIGLHVFVKGKGFLGFRDPDGNGNLNGQSLTVGPKKIGGVKIVRTDVGLSGPPALRSLVKLHNGGHKRITRVFSWCSNMGSDADTVVDASSSGDMLFGPSDRWIVTSDDATTPSDPPVTHVVYGAGHPDLKPSVLCAPGHLSDCVGVEFKVTLPARSTRYLLFYTELHDTNENAIAGTPKYNHRHLNSALLADLSTSVRNHVLNWDLG